MLLLADPIKQSVEVITTPPKYSSEGYVYNVNPVILSYVGSHPEYFTYVFHFKQSNTHYSSEHMQNYRHIEGDISFARDCFLISESSIPYDQWSRIDSYIYPLSRTLNRGLYVFKDGQEGRYIFKNKEERLQISELAKKIWNHLVEDKKEVIIYKK